MRFRFPSLAPDTASPDQVRAFREARGWTVEQLADAVHASPLEVSAWEAGAVRVPPEQEERMRWLVEVDEWSAKVARVRVEPCGWVREHAPQLYDTMFADVAGTWDAQALEVREHVVHCATCRAMHTHAERISPRPPDPADAPDTWRARYRRWTRRLPRWARWPFNLVAEFGILTAAILTMPDPDSGLPARIMGVVFGAVWWLIAFRGSTELLRKHLPRYRVGAGFLAGAAASMPAIVFWRLLDSSVQLGAPRLWLGAAAAGGALGLWSSWRKEPAEASAAATSPTRPRQSPGAPHLLPGTRVPGADEAPTPRAESVPVDTRSH